MTAKTIGYWATTGILSLAMLGSALGYLSGAMNEDMAHLGYPAHFILILGSWTLLVAPALLAPGLATVKQWAYAGLFFTFTGAAIAHIAVGDGIAHIAPPLVMLALGSISYLLHREVRFADSAHVPVAATRTATAT